MGRISLDAARQETLSIVGYALWLANEAFGRLVDLWPITIALIVLVLVSARAGPRELPQPQIRSLPSLLFMFPVLILIWGAAASADEPRTSLPILQYAVLSLILVLQTAFSAALIYVQRSSRRATAFFAVFLAWLSAVCGYSSILAINGTATPPV